MDKIINYFVSSMAVSSYGSGVSSFIQDQMSFVKGFAKVRLFIYDTFEKRYPPAVTFDCEVHFYREVDINKFDGVWYAHSIEESMLLSKEGIKHYVQHHHGDLLLPEKLNKVRVPMGIRPVAETEAELEHLRSELVTLIVQTEKLAAKFQELGIESLVARPFINTCKIVSEKAYDLCITGSIKPFKGVYLPINAIRNCEDKQIAVVLATPGQIGGDLSISEVRGIMERLGIPNPESMKHVDWYLGVTREEANLIMGESTRVLHPSFVEAYPMFVAEASQHTTVLVNKFANYHECLDYPVIPIDVTSLDDIFGPPMGPALDISKHNKLGEKEWVHLFDQILK